MSAINEDPFQSDSGIAESFTVITSIYICVLQDFIGRGAQESGYALS